MKIKNIVFYVIFLFIIINLKKNNKEKFTNSFPVWSCKDGINGYCYNINRNNFNKSDWKAPNWNETYNKRANIHTIYKNPAYEYSECEDWLADPLNTKMSNECFLKIKAEPKKKGGHKCINNSDCESNVCECVSGCSSGTKVMKCKEKDNPDEVPQFITVSQKSDGFKFYCANKKSNKYNCNVYNFTDNGKKYVGFGNNPDLSEDERKTDFLNYCRKYNKKDRTYFQNLAEQNITPVNVNRFEPSNNIGDFPTLPINDATCNSANGVIAGGMCNEIDCRRNLCNYDGNCKFNENKEICERNFDSLRVGQVVSKYPCSSRNTVSDSLKYIYDLSEKIKNKANLPEGTSNWENKKIGSYSFLGDITKEY